MKKILQIIIAIVTILSLPQAHAEDNMPLKLAAKITLPKVRGRIDHMAVDLKNDRLLIACAGNNTLEVVDLRAGKHLYSVAGFKKPQGVVCVSEYNKIYVTNGGNGECDILDGDSLKLINGIPLSDNADSIRYEPSGKLIYVGYGKGAIGIIDPSTDKLISRFSIDGHPESFQVESSGNRIYVNVPEAGNISVINKARGGIVDRWPLPNLKGNFSMALDEAGYRAFVGCGEAPTLVVFNTKAGEYVAKMKIDKDADDIYYDQARKRIYISCGSGFIDCFSSDGADHYTNIAKIKTPVGSRTSLFVQEQNRFYVAVPSHGKQPSEVWVYDAQ